METCAENRLRIEGTLTKQDFLKLFHSCKDARLKERYHGLFLGFSYAWDEVASILGRSPKQVRKWVRKYNKHGLEGLKSKKQKGNDPKLSAGQKAELKELVEQSPRDKGYPFSNWNAKSLKAVIQDLFRISVSQETVRRTLHSLGFVWKKPEHRFVLSNKGEKEKFRKKVERAIQRRKPNEVILFEDEVTARQHPTLTNTWILRGMRKFIGTFGNHAKRNAFGFVNILTGSFVSRITEGLKSVDFIAGLDEVKRKFRGKKVKLFIDKARCHTSGITTEYIEKNKSWLTVEFIPTQSPELSPVEILWQYMRKIVTHNHLFSTVQEIADALISFFSNLTKKEVLSICGGTYL